MTNQDASGRLFNIKQFMENSDYFGSDDVEALDMAWESLCSEAKDKRLDSLGAICYKTISGEYSFDEAMVKLGQALESIITSDVKEALINQ